MSSVLLRTILLLVASNVFMTFAWYAHLKNLSGKPWIIAAFVSWGIALFEYLLQVPANRIGYTALTLPQLKMLQEVITLAVFVPFAVFYMKQPVKLDYLWASLCILGAVYFMFRGYRVARATTPSSRSNGSTCCAARRRCRHRSRCTRSSRDISPGYGSWSGCGDSSRARATSATSGQ
jgi:uncharacterized protein (DUF486 family)